MNSQRYIDRIYCSLGNFRR